MQRTLVTLAALVAMTAALGACSKSKEATVATDAVTASDAKTTDATTADATSAPESEAKSVDASTAIKDIPLYPGAKETNKMNVAGGGSSGSSYDMRVYHSAEKSKAVADWYKDKLGSRWSAITSDTEKGYVATYTRSSDDGASSVVTVQPENEGTTLSITATGK